MRLIFILFFVFTLTGSYAQKSLKIRDNDTEYTLHEWGAAVIAPDPEDRHSPESLQNTEFLPFDDIIAHEDLTYWVKFSVYSEPPVVRKRLLRFSRYVTEVELYKFRGDNYELIFSSEEDGHSELNDAFFRYHPFELGEKPETFLVRMHMSGNFSRELHPVYLGISPVNTVSEQIHTLESILEFYFVFILLASFYNLWLFFRYRDKVSLLFAASLLGLGLYNLSLHGLEEIFFSHAFVARHLDIFPFLTGGLAVILVIVFCREFLHSREYVPFLDQMLLGLAIFTGIFMAIGMFTLHGVMNSLLFMTAGTSAVIVQIAGYIGYANGYKPAGFLALVTQLTALGVLMLALEQFGIISAEVTEIIILTGEGIRAIFVSRAIKIRIDRAQKTADLQNYPKAP